MSPWLLPIALGAVSALIVLGAHLAAQAIGQVPLIAVGLVGAIIWLSQRLFFERRKGLEHYSGLPDLLIHIHLPATPDSSSRWALRGGLSFLQSLVRLPVGIEGAATECVQALAIRLRPKAARWLEQRRRTDAACALAAAIAATLGAPWTAVLLVLELGVGGRAISVVISALTAAWLVGSVPGASLGAALRERLSGSPLELAALNLDPKTWLLAAVLASVGGAWALAWSSASALGRQQWSLFERYRIPLAAIVLVAWAVAVPLAHRLPQDWLWAAQQGAFGPGTLLLIAASVFVGALCVAAGFGGVGLFVPVLCVGALSGMAIGQWLVSASTTEVLVPFWVLSCWLGASAAWGGVWGAPLSAALLAVELSGSVSVLLPAALAGAGAHWIRKSLGVRTLLAEGLAGRGVKLIQGRAQAVLSEIQVRDAMVRDYEQAREDETVASLFVRLQRSRYPFLVITQSGTGAYLGLLSGDLIDEAWGLEQGRPAEVVEARDLLYRSGAPARAVGEQDSLADLGELLDAQICTPVLDEAGKAAGLLFNFNVRLAYDREVARRSLALQHRVMVR